MANSTAQVPKIILGPINIPPEEMERDRQELLSVISKETDPRKRAVYEQQYQETWGPKKEESPFGDKAALVSNSTPFGDRASSVSDNPFGEQASEVSPSFTDTANKVIQATNPFHDPYGKLQDISGGIQEGAKFLGATPAFIGAGLGAIKDVILGNHKPSVSLEAFNDVVGDKEHNAYDKFVGLLPESTQKSLHSLEDTEGAQYTRKVIDAAMSVFSQAGQGYGNIVGLLSGDEDLAKEFDSAMQMSLMVGMMARGKEGKGKPLPIDRTQEPKLSPTLEQPETPGPTGQGIEPTIGPTFGTQALKEGETFPPLKPEEQEQPLPPAQTSIDVVGGKNEPVVPQQQPLPETGQTAATVQAPPKQYVYEGGITYEAPPQEQPKMTSPVPENMQAPLGQVNVQLGKQLQKGIKGGETTPEFTYPQSGYIPTSREAFPSMQPPEEAGRPTTAEGVLPEGIEKRAPRLQPEEALPFEKGPFLEGEQSIGARIAQTPVEKFSQWADTLPDKIVRDPVVKRQIKQIRDQMDYVNTKLDEAKTQGLESTRLRQGEIGLTEKSKPELSRLERQIQNEQTILENLGNQLYERLKAKYPDQLPTFPQEGKEGPYSIQGQPISSTTPAGRQRGAIDFGDIGKGLSKILGGGRTPEQIRESLGYGNSKGPVSELMKQAGQPHQFDTYSKDNRPFKQIWDEDRDQNKPIQDLPNAKALVMKDFATGKSVSIFSEKYNGAGIAIKYANDKVRSIDRDTEIQTRKILGYELKNLGQEGIRRITRPWMSLIKGENSPFYWWDRKDTSTKDIGDMHNKALEKIMEGKEAAKEDFANEKQWKLYQGIRSVYKKGLDLVNEARVSGNMKPIQELPGYFATMLRGEYRLVGRDAQGIVKFLTGADTRSKANKWVVNGLTLGLAKATSVEELMGDMQKAHPDLKFQIVENKPDPHQLSDLSAFEEVMRALNADDPVAKAVHQTYISILKNRGFGAHALQRKGGWTGFMGSEGGYEGAKQMRMATEVWLNQAMRYRANLLKNRVLSDILDSGEIKWRHTFDEDGNMIPEKIHMIEKQIPNAISYISDYINNSTGAELRQWDILDARILDWSREAGFGSQAPVKVINKVGNFALFEWLARPAFYMVQAFQHQNILPRMLKEAGLGNAKYGDVLPSYFNGIKGMFKPDDIQTKAVNWGMENAYLDAKIINAFDAEAPWELRRLLGEIKTPTEAKDALITSIPNLSKQGIGKVEKEMVRIPTFLMLEKLFRDTIKDDETRFSRAAEMTDHYMVNYSMTEKPMIYNRLGLAGLLFGKLKQYSHNYYGQMFEFAGDLYRKKDPSAVPFAMFMLNNIFQSGLKGMIGLEFATGAINAYNAVTNSNIRTPEEWLFGHKLSDSLVFGGASKITGIMMHHAYDLSPGMAAPDVKGMFSSAPGEMAVSGFKAGMAGVHALQGEATPAEKLSALKGVSPSLAKGWIEQSYSKNGEVPVPAGGSLTFDYVRDAEEWLVRKFIGPRSLDEARTEGEIRSMNKVMTQDKEVSTKMLDILADQWINRQPLDQAVMHKYMFSDDGTIRGDPQKLGEGIVNRAKERLIPRVEQYLMKTEPNLSGAERLARMRQFNLIMDQNNNPEDLRFLNETINKK